MFRGITIFKCDKCGHKFISLDVEYMATAYSMPQTCPECGSNHTYPAGDFFSKGIYREIWSQMDKSDEEK